MTCEFWPYDAKSESLICHLKNKNKKQKNKQTKPKNKLTLISCITMLATLSQQQWTITVSKTLWKRDIILIKEACMLDMYGIIIFFPFSPLLAWKWTFEDLAHGIHTFVLQPHDFFWVQNDNRKSTTPEHSSLKTLLWFTLNFSLPVVKALKAFLVKRYHNGLQIYMATITEHKLNVFFLETVMPALGHFKLCCCQKQSKFSLKRKKEKEICPNYFWFGLFHYYYYYYFGFWSLSNVECYGFLVYNLILVFIIC